MLEDFPSRIAELLERFATRVRALTVDRIARLIGFVTLGMVAFVLVITATIFFLVGLSRIVGELVYKACECSLAMEIAYGIIGGLFLAVGALLWSRRTRAPRENDS